MQWSSFISSLSSGLASAFFAGVFIWIFQQWYLKKQRILDRYAKRVEDEEAKFYEKIKSARQGFYQWCRDYKDMSQDISESIVDTIQQAIDFEECSPVVLGKYKGHVDNIFQCFNEFSETFNNTQKLNNEHGEEKKINLGNLKLNELKDRIFFSFDEIDRVYFDMKKK